MEKVEKEMKNLVQIWFLVISCLCYCYVLGYAVSKGFKRLVFVVPVICLFFYLPLRLSSVYFCSFTSFFIAWLANFKLLLFAFGKGPLSSYPRLSLPRFLAIASLPIKVQENTEPRKPQKRDLKYAIKALVAAFLLQSRNNYYIHPKIKHFLNVLLVYICLDLTLVAVAVLAQFLIGLDLEPTFDNPYLSTSLQDFWGRRWNRMVPKILKQTIYEPIRNLASRTMTRKMASFIGILATFLVSSVMHDLWFYHLCREKPSVELMLFFAIQGLGLVAEILLKKLFGGRWTLPLVLSWCLTMVFIVVPGFWFFVPAMDRCNVSERVNLECDAFVNLIGNATRYVKFTI